MGAFHTAALPLLFFTGFSEKSKTAFLLLRPCTSVSNFIHTSFAASCIACGACVAACKNDSCKLIDVNLLFTKIFTA